MTGSSVSKRSVAYARDVFVAGLLPSRGRGWFCDGMYDPDDHRNPPSASRLLDGEHSAAVEARIWLAQHRRWRELVDSIASAHA